MLKVQVVRSLVSRLALAGVVVGTSLFAVDARAQWSPASVFTDDGVEIGVEPRLFALFALLNAAGYDKESVFGPEPLALPQFSATRSSLRDNLGRSSPTEFLAVIKKHPVSVQDYMAAALELGAAPRFDNGATKNALAKDLGPVLRSWYNEEGGSALLRNANDAVRDTQKKLLPTVDKAVKATNKLVRLGDATDQLLDDVGASGRVALVLNDLDAHGTLVVLEAGDTTGIIRGPVRNDADDALAVDALILAYAKTVVAGEVAKVDPAGSLLPSFKKVGADTKKAAVDAKGWATHLMACSVAREIRARPVACPGLAGDAHSEATLALIAPRMKAYAPTTALFAAALPEMLAEAPPAPEGAEGAEGAAVSPGAAVPPTAGAPPAKAATKPAAKPAAKPTGT